MFSKLFCCGVKTQEPAQEPDLGIRPKEEAVVSTSTPERSPTSVGHNIASLRLENLAPISVPPSVMVGGHSVHSNHNTPYLSEAARGSLRNLRENSSQSAIQLPTPPPPLTRVPTIGRMTPSGAATPQSRPGTPRFQDEGLRIRLEVLKQKEEAGALTPNAQHTYQKLKKQYQYDMACRGINIIDSRLVCSYQRVIVPNLSPEEREVFDELSQQHLPAARREVRQYGNRTPEFERTVQARAIASARALHDLPNAMAATTFAESPEGIAELDAAIAASQLPAAAEMPRNVSAYSVAEESQSHSSHSFSEEEHKMNSDFVEITYMRPGEHAQGTPSAQESKRDE